MVDEEKNLEESLASYDKKVYFMKFKWIDYSRELADTVEGLLDEEAVRMTGIDEGFDDYYSYWANEENTVLGENFWCKVILKENTPVGVMVLGKSTDGEFIMSEIIVSPAMRGHGVGGAVLCEFLDNGEYIIGQKTKKVMAVIFPNNIASQRCFEKAGFKYVSSHPDGDAWYYRYTAK